MATRDKLEAMRLPELWQRYQAATGSKTRTPNKAYLVKTILAAEQHKRTEGRKAARGDRASASEASSPDGRPKRGRFTGMTVEQLRALYAETLGRSTESTDAAYLQWKIREAEKGHVAIGPVHRRHRDEPVVPVTLRFGRSELARIDAALARAGVKNRTRFLMAAIGKHLVAIGEAELGAVLVGPDASADGASR
jgi:hypothetical protein